MVAYPDAIPTFTGIGDDDEPIETWAAQVSDETVAVATTLGTNPEGAFSTVRERLEDIEAAVAAGDAGDGAALAAHAGLATHPYTNVAKSWTATQTFQPASAAGVPVIAKGLAAQTGALIEGRDSADAVVAKLAVSGAWFTPGIRDLAGTGPFMDFSTASVAVVNRNTIGNPVLLVKGMLGQTGPLQQWLDSTHTQVAAVGPIGNARFSSLTVNADLPAGHRFEVAEGTPAVTDRMIGRVMGGNAAARLGTVTHGFGVQLFAGDWSLPVATVMQANHALADIPAAYQGSMHAYGGVVASAATDRTVEVAPFWGLITGSGGARLWGAALHVHDTATVVGSASERITGLELSIERDVANPTKVATGYLASVWGDHNVGIGLLINRENLGNAGNWRVGIRTEIPDIAQEWWESDQITWNGSAWVPDGDGMWRLAVDAGTWRLDKSTDSTATFGTFGSPFTIDAVGDLHLGGQSGAGSWARTMHVVHALGNVGIGATAHPNGQGLLTLGTRTAAPSTVPTAAVNLEFDGTNLKAHTPVFTKLLTAPDEIVLSASQMAGSNGTPELSSGITTAGVVAAWRMDAASPEQLSGVLLVPSGWATADIELWWANGAAGAGNVRWRITAKSVSDGELFTTSTTDTSTTAAAPASDTMKKSTLASGAAVTPGEMLRLVLVRVADDVLDTLANDASVVAIVLRRAS